MNTDRQSKSPSRRRAEKQEGTTDSEHENDHAAGEAEHGLQVACILVLNRITEAPVRVTNMLDRTVSWEKGEMVSALELVDLVTGSESGKQAPDVSFKKDLLAAVHEEIEPAEERRWGN